MKLLITGGCGFLGSNLAADALDGYTVLGELALDGVVTPVTGVLAAAIGSGAARGIVCPEACGGGIEVQAPATLLGLFNHFTGRKVIH